MKIILLHNHYQQEGGEDFVFREERDLLRSRGHQVFTYTLHNDQIEEMNSLALVKKTLWNREIYTDLKGTLARLRPEIVHVHNTFPLLSPAVYYAAQRLNIPVVQTLHNFRLFCLNALFLRDSRPCELCLGKTPPWPGVWHRCYRDNRAASAVTALMLTLHRGWRTWAREVDCFIALTEFCRQKFIAGGLEGSKIVVKPNFVSPDRGPGKGGGDFALFVGRLSKEKGILTLLEAWEGLEEGMKLKVVGAGPLAELVQKKEEEAAAIDYRGKLPLSEVMELMARARMLIFPSQWYETFGRVAVEAFSRGTPVIASRLGAMGEIVDDQRTGLLFEPGRADDLAVKVRSLWHREERLKEMRVAARREFEEKYTAQENYRRLMKIYSEVREEKGRGI